MIDLRCGDCLDVLRTLPAGSVHCCVTSPPYWGLRDYGVDGQIGLEATPDAFVARMVEVFREVRRCLRDDGTLWLNLGDSFNSSPSNQQGRKGTSSGLISPKYEAEGMAGAGRQKRDVPGLKPKDLVGIPWRVAFALQADGWYLRSDIIWHKPNPMPESVRDRPTKSHEYLFLLSKAERYYFDAEAVREEAEYGRRSNFRGGGHYLNQGKAPDNSEKMGPTSTTKGADPSAGRNIRTVWTIATRPYKGAHFATFPPKLVEPCIKAGTSERGCCPECGKPWERVVERQGETVAERLARTSRHYQTMPRTDGGSLQHCGREMTPHGGKPSMTIGWRPACDHGREPVPCVVLDPFAGSGTTGAVASQLGRSFLGIELNPAYLELARQRIEAA